MKSVNKWDRIYIAVGGVLFVGSVGSCVEEASRTGKMNGVWLVYSASLQRLFCYDSEGELDELVIKNKKFAGFKLVQRAKQVNR